MKGELKNDRFTKDIFDANIDKDTQKGKYLTFIESGIYAIEIKFIFEIIGIQPIFQ